jgi:hypothetical protein
MSTKSARGVLRSLVNKATRERVAVGLVGAQPSAVYGLWLCEGGGVGWPSVGLGEGLGDSVGLGDELGEGGEGLRLGDAEGLGNPGVINTGVELEEFELVELELCGGTGIGCSEEISRSRAGTKFTLGEGATPGWPGPPEPGVVGTSAGVWETNPLRLGRGALAEEPVSAS